MRPTPLLTVIPGSTVATQSASTETKKATNKKQKQNLNQTMSCTEDGGQKSEAVKGEHSTVATQSASTETKKATNKKQKQNLNQTMSYTADGEQKSEAVKAKLHTKKATNKKQKHGEQKSEAVKGERELSSTMDY